MGGAPSVFCHRWHVVASAPRSHTAATNAAARSASRRASRRREGAVTGIRRTKEKKTHRS